MGILDTGATCLFITKRDTKITGLTTLGPYNKTIAVKDNTVIHALHKTRLPYNLPSARWKETFS